MHLATNLRATRRDRTNVCMCHVDHLLQLPWACHSRVPPTEAARHKLMPKNDLDCDESKDFILSSIELSASVRPPYPPIRT
jgi:hypothetical protein